MTRKKIKFIAFLWHRRIGLAAIALVIILSITGILLNHTETFQLDETYVESSALLNWYGLEPEGSIISYKVNGHTISTWDKTVFFDNQPLAQTTETLNGAVWAEQLIIAAFDTEIFLLTHEGELVERMPTSQSFSGIQKLGLKYKRPVIETGDSLYYIADEHILDWDVIANADIEWSVKHEPGEIQVDKLRQAFRGKGLSMERVVLDLHSGRIFGQYGIYLMDASAIALLWLSFSGLWVWWSRRVKQKQKRHYKKHHRK
jgi:hypothetical protein